MSAKDFTKVYHVDWDRRMLDRVELLENEARAMPEKGTFFETLLYSGDTVMTVFSTSHAHNKLPESMMAHDIGALKWNKNYSIPDFGIDESGVYGSLSFNSKLQFVYLSWDSIIEITGTPSGQSAAWPRGSEGLDNV